MSDKQPNNLKEVGASPDPPPASVDATASGEEKRKKEKADEATEDILRDIPIVGRPLVWVKRKFGWKGIVLILAGFLVALILTRTGYLPPALIWPGYKAPTPPPLADSGYELILDPPDSVLTEAMGKAQFNMEISGIALKFINLNILKEKIEHGFRADIVVLDPCEDAVLKRSEYAGHYSGARRNILSLLEGLKGYVELLPADKRSHLQVKLSKRPATMVVGMFDRRRELYAYWCRYGAPCTNSPVLAFRNYAEKNPDNKIKNEVGFFFENHYDAVFSDATPKDFSTYDPKNPCPAPDSKKR